MSSHPLRYRRLGRGFHPIIDTAADLAAVPDLDDVHWVATAATIDTLRGDAVFLKSLDSDGDGRIRSDELRAAIRWTFDHLADTAGVTAGADSLALTAVRADAPDAPTMLDAARRVHGELGKAGATAITLAEVREIRAREEAKGLSEAGRIRPAAAGEDAPLAAFLTAIVDATGGEPHPLGAPAVSEATLVRYLDEGAAWLAWHDKGQVPDGEDRTDVQPLGADTAGAAAALEAVQDKLEQYFLLCDAVALDPSIAAHAWVDATGADLLDAEVARGLLGRAPLARPRADGVLDLDGPINPAWRARLAAFTTAAGPLLPEGSRELTRAHVAAVAAALAPFQAWRDSAPADAVKKVGVEALRAQLADAGLPDRTRALLKQSEVAAAELGGVKTLEKLLLYQQGLLVLANSVVTMRDAFAGDAHALFENGTLILDGRVFNFAVKVNDAKRAETFAARSPMFIMFVQVGDKGGALDRELMIPITAGERGHVVENMWGVFYDLNGKEQHARIRKIAASPISIKEALLAPFRRLNDTFQKMADKAAAEQTSSMDAQLTTQAQSAVDASSKATQNTVAAGEAAKAAPAPAPAPAAAPAEPASSGLTAQLPLLLAGGGVALAAVSAAGAYVIDVIWSAAGALASAFLGLSFIATLPEAAVGTVQVLALPVALVVILLGILLIPFLVYAIPIAIATWLRLRRRDLATLLEGSGWAVNTRLYLTKDQAGNFTKSPGVPVSQISR